MPPLAGFIGKFAIFASLASAWQVSNNSFMLWLLILGGLNTAVSLFYYLRVVKVMTIDPERDSSPGVPSLISWLGACFVAVLVIPIVTLLIYADRVNSWTQAAVEQLF